MIVRQLPPELYADALTLWDQTGLVSLLVIPEFIWEAFLGIYCAIWGFRKGSPILRPAWRGDAAA